jgi:hypothetical protein
MPESTPQVIAELVKPLLDFFLSRDERRAVEDSNELRFWQDGMLRQLKAIANGTATDETYKQLKANFEETDGPVREAMKRMAEARSRVRDGELERDGSSLNRLRIPKSEGF